ncbi:glycosyltransferase [Mycobacterium xenopi]
MFGQADAVAKRRLLAKARCLLFPIQWEEPFGMVMIEAMACGTPVVALDRGAVREIVDDGVTGFVCADPAELAPAIRRVTGLDPQVCRRHVKERFSAEQMALGYERLYRQVIDAQVLPAAVGANEIRQPIVVRSR